MANCLKASAALVSETTELETSTWLVIGFPIVQSPSASLFSFPSGLLMLIGYGFLLHLRKDFYCQYNMGFT